MQTLLMILLSFTSVFMILIVMLQRGRGGGLAGAFGGMGGQSAFGTKAGDLFTRITIGVAACWILLSIVALRMSSANTDSFDPDLGQTARQRAQQPAATAPADITPPAATTPPASETPASDAQK